MTHSCSAGSAWGGLKERRFTAVSETRLLERGKNCEKTSRSRTSSQAFSMFHRFRSHPRLAGGVRFPETGCFFCSSYDLARVELMLAKGCSTHVRIGEQYPCSQRGAVPMFAKCRMGQGRQNTVTPQRSKAAWGSSRREFKSRHPDHV